MHHRDAHVQVHALGGVKRNVKTIVTLDVEMAVQTAVKSPVRVLVVEVAMGNAIERVIKLVTIRVRAI